MEWEGPAVVLDARVYNEADALVTVMTEAQGAHRGLARGGSSRRQASLWQRGNVVHARWVGRLADQLGSMRAELVHPGAALAMEDALALAVVSSACMVAEGALPEREAHPAVFGGLMRLIAGLGADSAPVETVVRWEAALLTELGYGLDLSRCAVTGAAAGLRWVSPRSGRAVSAEGAGEWAARLLPLPGFLAGGSQGDAAAWRDGLRLTGHFLARDAFGHQNRPLPAARQMLYDRVVALAVDSGTTASLDRLDL